MKYKCYLATAGTEKYLWLELYQPYLEKHFLFVGYVFPLCKVLLKFVMNLSPAQFRSKVISKLDCGFGI